MPQQINLCTPIFLRQKHYFSAKTMAQAMGVFLLLGGILTSYWTWSLNKVSAGYQQSIANNQREIDRLQAAIKISKDSSAPADAALVQELKERGEQLQRRERLLSEFRRGLAREGWGHSARMQLVSQSIPPQVWVTEVKADDARLELGGYTLEPAALNAWMERLAASPLLKGQQLATVKVERSATDVRNPAGAPVAAPAGPAVWSFVLVSAVAASPADTASGARP